MIAYLKGTVVHQGLDSIIVDHHQMGYEVFVSRPYDFPLNQKATVFTYQHVREDAIILFGFETEAEKEVFLSIIGVKGIGPKTAMNMLAKTDGERFIEAIETEDLAYLTTLPGVGKKTASQMLLDLKGKFRYTASMPNKVGSKNVDEALFALEDLGFSQTELKRIQPQLAQETNQNIEHLIKKGLQLIHGRKGGL